MNSAKNSINHLDKYFLKKQKINIHLIKLEGLGKFFFMIIGKVFLVFLTSNFDKNSAAFRHNINNKV